MPEEYAGRAADEAKAIFNALAGQIQQDEFVSFHVAKVRKLKDERAPKEEKWKEALNAYNLQLQGDKDGAAKYRHQLCLPLVLDAVEENTATIGRALVPPHEEAFKVKCGDDRMLYAADVVSRFLHEEIRKYDLDQLDQVVKMSVLYGSAAIKMFWCQKTRRVIAYDKATKKLMQTETVERDNVKVEASDPFCWLFETDKAFGEGLFFSYWTEDEITFRSHVQQGIYHQADKVQYDYGEQASPFMRHEEERQEGKRQADLSVQSHDGRTGCVRILSVVGDLVCKLHDGTFVRLEKHRAIIANETVLISLEPILAFDGTYDHLLLNFLQSPDPRNPYGISLISQTMAWLHAANETLNALLDSIEQAVRGAWMANPRDEAVRQWIKKDGKIDAVGKVIFTSNGLAPLPVGSEAKNLGFATIGEMGDRFQQGNKSIQNFAHRNYEKTATEIAGILEMMGQFQAKTIAFIQKNFFAPYLQKRWNMFMQFKVMNDMDGAVEYMAGVLKEPDLVGKLQQNGLDVTALFQAWEFEPTAATLSVVRNKKVQDLISLLKVATETPNGDMNIKVRGFIETISRLLEVENRDDLIASPEEAQENARARHAAMEEAQRQEIMQRIIQAEPAAASVIKEQDAKIAELTAVLGRLQQQGAAMNGGQQ